jgi:hypothetical protein
MPRDARPGATYVASSMTVAGSKIVMSASAPTPMRPLVLPPLTPFGRHQRHLVAVDPSAHRIAPEQSQRGEPSRSGYREPYRR